MTKNSDTFCYEQGVLSNGRKKQIYGSINKGSKKVLIEKAQMPEFVMIKAFSFAP